MPRCTRHGKIILQTVRSASKRDPLLVSTNGSNRFDPKTNMGDRFRPQSTLGSTRWVRRAVSVKRQAEERRRCISAAPCRRRRRGGARDRVEARLGAITPLMKGGMRPVTRCSRTGGLSPKGIKVAGDLHGRFVRGPDRGRWLRTPPRTRRARLPPARWKS
jgi:hypothetical protein